MGDHLGRQRPVAVGPTHVPLDAFSEGFLRYTDLKRSETSFVPDPLGDHLVDRGSAGASSREDTAREQSAHRRVVAVARSGQSRRGTVQTGDDVDVLSKGCERLQTGSERVISSRLLGYPVFLRDAVAVEPEDKARLDGLSRQTSGGIGGAARVEHRLERGKADSNRSARQSDAAQERAPGKCRHDWSVPRKDSVVTIASISSRN